jgi:hypothetical protein
VIDRVPGANVKEPKGKGVGKIGLLLTILVGPSVFIMIVGEFRILVVPCDRANQG